MSSDAHGPQPIDSGPGLDCEMCRRDAMKTGAAGAAALLGAGSFSQSGQAMPLSPAGGLINAGAGVANYVIGAVWGDDDTSEIEEAEANELHDRVYGDAVEIEPEITDHYEGKLNQAQFLEEYVRTNVAFRIAERAQAGDSESEVMDAAEDEVAETVASLQERHGFRYERDALRMARRINLVMEESELSVSEVFGQRDYQRSIHDDTNTADLEDTTDWLDGDRYHDVPLVDGSSISLPFRSHGTFLLTLNTADQDLEEDFETDVVSRITVERRDGAGNALIFDPYRYFEVMVEFEELYEQEVQHAETIVNTLYQPIVDGEVDAHDIASGRAVVEAAEDPDHYGEAAGFYRAVGIPEALNAARVRLPGVELEGKLFWTLPPDDGGLPVGDEIVPEGELGDLYLAADVVEVGDEIGEDLGDEFDVEIQVFTESGDPLGEADVTIFDDTETTDSDGIVTIEGVPEGLRTVEIDHGDETTVKEIDVGEEANQSTTFDLTHDHEDHTDDGDNEDEESTDDLEEGDVVITTLSSPFEIVGIDGGGDTLVFETRELIDPDEDDQDDITDRMRDAYDDEQQTREERQEIVLDQDFDVSLPGLPDIGGVAESAVMGLAVIGGAILLVVGVVSNLFDSLLP